MSGGTATGYFFRKCCDESKLGGDSDYGDGTGLSFIRYADIMLLYAEALTELDVDRNRDEIEKQLFELRNRAGIQPGTNKRYGVPENMDKDEMIDFIINERRIEFANECGNRFWDLKRFNTEADYAKTITRKFPVVSTDVEQKTYTLKPDSRLYIIPFPMAAREKNPNLTLNTNE